MHKLAISAALVERIVARRGTRHVFSDLKPAKTALLVIDLQNAYMLNEVAHAYIPAAIAIVPNVNHLAAELRGRGGLVVWVQNTVTNESLADWRVNEELTSPERREARIAALSEGTPGHALWEGLEVREQDTVLCKTRLSAFIQGSSDIEPLLRRRGIDTVIVTGTNTGVCCESTARDAMMRGFRTIMVSDANAAADDEQHNAALAAFYRNFGDVMSTEEVVEYLSSAR